MMNDSTSSAMNSPSYTTFRSSNCGGEGEGEGVVRERHTHTKLLTCLKRTMVSMLHSRASAISLLEVMPKGRLSWISATALKARAPLDSRSSKKPIRTTSSLAENFLAASTSVSSMAGGPVFFSSQFTISLEVLPPVGEKRERERERWGGGGEKSMTERGSGEEIMPNEICRHCQKELLIANWTETQEMEFTSFLINVHASIAKFCREQVVDGV